MAGRLQSRIALSDQPLQPARLLAEVANPAAGATVLFLGTVRDHSPGKHDVTKLEYEAYEEEVGNKIGDVVDRAAAKWPLIAVAIEHRVGTVALGEPSVAVAVSSAHRRDAFEAAHFLIDELKAGAPIWKKEHWPGGAEWVEDA